MKSFILKCRYIWRGLSTSGQPHLGGMVSYRGEPCRLTQGVADPYWNLVSVDGERYYQRVHVSEFVVDKSLSARWAVVKLTYRFYMDYWHGIHLRNFWQLKGRL